MNRMRSTSLQALSEIREHLPTARSQVFEVIERCYPICDQQIAEALGWAVHRVSPRRGELVDQGLIETAGKLRWRGRVRHFWQPRLTLFASPDMTD